MLVSSHIDTVPPFWEYERKGEEIWGRGTVDAKGSVAAQIIAVEELRKKGKLGEGDVGLLFVVGEETGGDGMKKVGVGGETRSHLRPFHEIPRRQCPHPKQS